VLGVACLGAGAWVAAADTDQPAQPPQPAQQDQRAARPGQAEAIKLEGTVAYYNLGPMGEMESINLLTGDGLVQLIMPPVAGEKIATLAPEGSKVQATAMAEPNRPPRGQAGPRRGGQDGAQGQDAGGGGPADRAPGQRDGQNGQGGQDGPPDRGADAAKADHKIYRLVSLTVDGKTIELAAGKPSEAHVEGTIKHLNYDRAGAIDGAIMDSGELVLFNPSASAELKLQAGQKLTADGMSRQLPNGQVVVAAETVNGVKVPPMPQRGGPGQRGPGNGDQRGGPQGGPQGGDRNGPPGGGPDGGPGPQ